MSSEVLETCISELLAGKRLDGGSMVECCLEWQITETEYKALLDSSLELRRAHEIGDMHCASWWHSKSRDLAAKGNASVMTFALKNMPKIGWQDKPDTKEEKEVEPLRAINISIMKPRVEDEDDDS